MNRTRAPAFHSAEKLLAPGRRVAVMGDISRTWHKDEGVLVELLEYLLSFEADVAAIGASPFRLCVERSFELGEYHCDVWDEKNPEAAAFLSCSDLVVVLGPRTSRELPRPRATASVLVLWPDDHATFIAASAAASNA